MKRIFIATGNKDKLVRIKAWFRNMDVEILSPFDFSDEELISATKLNYEEESKLSTMQERARAKAKKAAVALDEKGEKDLYVLGMDDTMYIPLLRVHINDLRNPQELIDPSNGKIIMESPNEFLKGYPFAQYWVDVVSEVGTGVDNLNYKVLQIEWQFAVAISNTDNPNNTEIIAEWNRLQYLRNVMPETLEDNGYVMDSFASENPKGEVNRVHQGHWTETVPTEAVTKLFS